MVEPLLVNGNFLAIKEEANQQACDQMSPPAIFQLMAPLYVYCCNILHILIHFTPHLSYFIMYFIILLRYYLYSFCIYIETFTMKH